MDGYRTQSPNMSREAEQVLFRYYATLEPWEKMRIIEEMNRTADDAAIVGIRSRHPYADDQEIRHRLAALKYGRDLTVKFLGWDPHVGGW
jgi:hypothetical protein